MDRCKPLVQGNRCDKIRDGVHGDGITGKGLHSFTSQLNMSALYGIGGICRGLCSPFQWGVRGCVGCVGCSCASDTAQVQLKSERVSAPDYWSLMR